MTEKIDEVVTTPIDGGTDSTPVKPSEEVTSPEVKVETEVQAPVKEDAVSAKMQEQIDNLNKALRLEREANKNATKEWEQKIGQSQETIDKLKEVFSPKQIEEPTHEALTIDQVEALLEAKEEKRKEEERRLEQQRAIKSEVLKLESEWDGTDGKPKYEDEKVLAWQESNRKLHLSPSEAFNEMNRDSIIDWEIKSRMAKKPPVQNVETPGATPVGREPEETLPKTTSELRNAVLEAMQSASSENIN